MQSWEGTARRATDIVALKASIDDALGGRRAGERGVALLTIDLGEASSAADDAVAFPRLQAALRDDDVLACIGDRRYAVVCPGATSVTQAWVIGRRLLRGLGLSEARDPAITDDVILGAVVGAGVGVSAGALLRDALAALDQARRPSPVRMVVIDQSNRGRWQPQQALADDLRAAITADDLALHYQPVVDVRSGRTEAVEALLRWTHPRDGALPPNVVVETAERTGLMLALGEWVLRTACAQMAAWRREQPNPPAVLCVNVSAHQLDDPDFADIVQRALGDAGVDAGSLCLELTESALLSQTPLAMSNLERIRATGVRIAIDDFGTGYSSLAYLKELPVDVLKIAREFVTEIANDPRDRAIVQAIATLADALDMTVIVEGVEDAEQLAVVAGLGCTLIQGYLLRRPSPSADALAPIEVPPLALAV